MNTHALITYDDKTYYISEEQARIAATRKDESKTIEFRSYPGEFIMPGNVKHIGATSQKQEVNQSSRLQLDHEELQALTAPGGVYADLFYRQILDWNFAREKHNKPWVFKKAVEFAKQESGYNTPQDVIEFMQAEWETVKDYNQSSETIDWLGRKQIKDWLMTDQGREYSQTHNR